MVDGKMFIKELKETAAKGGGKRKREGRIIP